jgi:hypothetical protein
MPPPARTLHEAAARGDVASAEELVRTGLKGSTPGDDSRLGARVNATSEDLMVNSGLDTIDPKP